MLIECVKPCEHEKCLGYNENPHCLDEQTWGCNTCEAGYWRESLHHPCVSCNIIPNCSSCSNYSGCNICKNGYKRIWDTSCGYGIGICVKI